MAIAKYQQTRWLKIIKKYDLIVLEDKSPKSRFWQGDALSEDSGRQIVPRLSLASGVPSNMWHSLACTCVSAVSASITTWPSPSVSESLFSLIKTPVISDQSPLSSI